ncbi:MAG: aryl-sulfate sulfotransferase [Candidatus Heimdallarchaeaceae archaeon]
MKNPLKRPLTKKTKRILISVGIVFGLLVAGGGSLVLYLEFRYVAKPFDLSDAPQYILDIKDDLSQKLIDDTFIWADMVDFVNFAQYVADNSPDVLDEIRGWEQTTWFNITDAGHLWLIVGNDSIIFEIVPVPLATYGISLELNFDVVKEILREDISTQQAFQTGKLSFEGNLDEVLKVSWLVETAAATIMGTYTSPYEVSDNFKIRFDNTDLYNSEGLTVMPYVTIALNPDLIGQVHGGVPLTSDVIIVNSRGEIVYRLGENTLNTVQKFLNSTTIISGGKTYGPMELWNFQTGERVVLSMPSGHHCLDYNPVTETIMVLEHDYNFTEFWDGNIVLYDSLREYTLDGTVVWEWNGVEQYPFNSTRHTEFGLNLTFAGGADWMHANSFAWDKQDGEIYLNMRNLDTIVKIDYDTKDIIWEVGRDSNFTFYNKEDDIVDAIMHAPHGLEKIGDNRFIIFDNDLYNTSNPQTMNLEGSLGYSRMLEFEIDDDNRTVKEVWSWTPSNQSYYLPESGGDTNRLPDGNTIAIFGNKAEVLNLRDPIYLTEVTPAGEIAWELMIDGDNNTYFWVQNFERFYEQPVINIQESLMDIPNGILNLDLTTWNCYKTDYETQGTVKIIADGEIIYEDDFSFEAYFKSNILNISLTSVPSSVKHLEIVIENQDGIQGVEILFHKGSSISTILISTLVPVGTVGIFIGTYFILKKKNKLPSFLKRE